MAFKNLDTQGMEQPQDRTGGFQTFESGIYEATIKALYGGEAKSGAMSLTLIADIDGREYRETLYVTSGREKGGKPYYEKNGKKYPLPGFSIADAICLIATGEPLEKQQDEEKVIKLYDFDAKAEVPTAVPMLTAALGQKVALGILKKLENKNEKDGSGKYVPTAETREVNAIDAVFHPELKVTVKEAREGKESAFWETWEKQNAGKTQDKRTIKDGAPAAAGGGSVGRPPSAGAPAAAAPRVSLFGKK